MPQQVFDSVALSYDTVFTYSKIGKAQRNQVYASVVRNTSLNQKRILELNCGTGEDVLWLKRGNNEITATDVSEVMISVAQKKAEKANVEVNFKVLKIQDVSQLKPNNYDLIFSNFGGLNCLNKDELTDFVSGCGQLQMKKQKIALVIMSSNCLWERFFYLLKGDKKNAFRRRDKKGTKVILNNMSVDTFYYSPFEIKKMFGKEYTTIAINPVGFLVPPSYLETWVEKHVYLFKVFVFLDRLLCRIPFLADYSDHFLIILEKNKN